MSEIEIAKITTHIETIKSDISELKENNKEMVRAITKLAVIEDRFKANDESHRLLWEKLNKTAERVQASAPAIETVKDWKKNIGRVWVAIAVMVAVEIVRLVMPR